MKIRRLQTPDQSRTPCWCPNRRRARRRRVSNPDCAGDARPHSRREQHAQSAAPLLIGGESPLRARSLASSFSRELLAKTHSFPPRPLGPRPLLYVVSSNSYRRGRVDELIGGYWFLVSVAQSNSRPQSNPFA